MSSSAVRRCRFILGVMVVMRRAASDGHNSGWWTSPKAWSVQDLEFRRRDVSGYDNG